MFINIKAAINSFLFCLICTIFFLGQSHNSIAQSAAPANFSQVQLEKLVQPIALYPDILLQQLLAASTFPEQLIDAAMYHEQAKNPKNIAIQPWDDSVKAIANYPSILTMMVNDIDWTISLASALVNQSVDLKKAIQTLRSKAKTFGNLKTSDYETITSDIGPKGETVIKIESADPQVVYAPSPNSTTIVYQESVNTSDYFVPVASFGLGMALGYAMGDDDDDHYYGGYYGPGFWYREDAVNNWVDYRNDRWDDAYDFANDRQDWRQDNADDWREYRQDLGRDRQDWANQRKANGNTMSPEKRAEVQSKAAQGKANWSGKSSQEKQDAWAKYEKGSKAESFDRSKYQGSSFDKDAASQRLNQARLNPQVQERVKSSDNWNTRTGSSSSGSFSGSGSSSFSRSPNGSRAGSANSSLRGISSSGRAVGMAQSRGAASRGSLAGAGRGGRR